MELYDNEYGPTFDYFGNPMRDPYNPLGYYLMTGSSLWYDNSYDYDFGFRPYST